MKILDPLAVAHIALAARHVFDVASIDQSDIDTASFEDLKKRNPIHAGGLHGDGGNTTFKEPVCQYFEIFREGGKGAHWFIGTICGDADDDLSRANVSACGVGVDDGQRVDTGSAGRFAPCVFDGSIRR